MDDQLEEVSLGQTEQPIICPHCWQEVTILVDLSQPLSEFIEDCEACCNPIQLRCEVEEGEVVSFTADRTD